MDVEKSRRHDHVVAEILHRQVKYLDTNTFLYLLEILARDPYPLLLVLDQKVAPAGIAAEALTKTFCEPIIARGVHLEMYSSNSVRICSWRSGVIGFALSLEPM